jgi:hypothetical protein
VNRVYGPVDHFRSWSTVDRRHRAQSELVGALTAWCYGAPKLTTVVWGGRGRRGGEVRKMKKNWKNAEAKIGRRGGEVAPAAERNGIMASVLGVWWLGAQISGDSWGKTLRGK